MLDSRRPGSRIRPRRRSSRLDADAVARIGHRVGKPAQDPHSFARPDEARVTDVALDLTADFSAHTLRGTATLTLVVCARCARGRVRHKRVDDRVRERSEPARRLTFRLGPADPLLGQALTVSLGPASQTITVHYTTSPDAGALQWLSPAQTAGHVHPYLFSQGESIYTRTWIPTQDSPGIRQTYRARIVVPSAV